MTFSSEHPREGGDPVLSSVTPVLQDLGRRITGAATSPKELGPRLRGDERSY